MDFDDFFEVLEDSDFEEIPAELETFVTSKDYLGLPPLSSEQYTLIRAMTQIYYEHTLIELYGEEVGRRMWKETCDEVIAQWGKGSGKDYCSTIAVSYVVHLLLCLKDPAKYYGKPPGDSIDILNIAINADQAKNVFFKGLKTRVEKSPWFEGKYRPTANAIEFDKSITCYSGHSEREAWEGYNLIMAILDEIAGFAVDNTTGHAQAKTAGEIYKMYRGSVVSRFDIGKVVLLSFPRYKGDFIQQRYNEVVNERHTIIKTHTFKIDESLPDGFEGNEFTVEWDHVVIDTYNVPNVYASKRTSWEVNPTKTIRNYMKEFLADPIDALSRFACMPPDAVDAFFKSREKVEGAFVLPNPFTDSWRFYESFQPDPDKTYYVHIDLAQKHDRAVAAMAHVENWTVRKISDGYDEPQPFVKVDCVRYWTPRPGEEIDFTDIRNFVISLRQRGFNIALVTLDRWQSIDTMKFFNDNGMLSERLSVAKKHYEDLQMLIQEERLKGPLIQILIDELLQLRIMRGDKIDHPRTGSKDLSDAVCGAAYNAVAYTERDVNRVIEVSYLEPQATKQTNKLDDGVIRNPKATSPAPTAIAEFLSGFQVI